MVLGPQGPGRVGRRRFFVNMSPVSYCWRGLCVFCGAGWACSAYRAYDPSVRVRFAIRVSEPARPAAAARHDAKPLLEDVAALMEGRVDVVLIRKVEQFDDEYFE